MSGPYARYAQKYLGVRAPLTDKTVWSVTGAQIALLDGDTYLNAAAPAPASTRVLSHTASENKFARLQPDKTDMTTPALEDAARTAAAQIFSLRRHRIELVTGEAGENVFGEGLKAALEEIDRLEQSYLELFLGKRIVSTETRRYVVCPQADKKQYIVCRFSPAAGLLPDTDLSGDIVLLQIEPSGVAKSDLEEKSSAEMIGRMNTKITGMDQIVGSLSGGNMQKVILAKWLLNDPDIIIFDEPTRGIDVGAKAEIYKIIEELACKGKGIIIISSEMPELIGLSQRIIVLHEGEQTGELRGEEMMQENIMALASGYRKEEKE